MIGISIIIFGAVMPIVSNNIWTVSGFNGSAYTLVKQIPLLLTAGVIVAVIASVFIAVKMRGE